MATIGLLFLGRKRPGFDPDWGSHMATLVRAELSQLSGHSLVCEAHANDDLSLRQALDQFRAAGVDVPVLLQTTMSDGRLAPRLGQYWPNPVVLWATPENADADKVSSCSLVGTHVFAANLRQLHRPFQLVYGSPGEELTRSELQEALCVAASAAALRLSRIGLVGYHAPGFIDMHADPFLLSRQLGGELFHTGIQELLDRMQALPEDLVRNDVAAVLEMGLPMDKVGPEDLSTASRAYLAMKQFITEECLDALALREWPEIPNMTGQWPYLAISRLLNDGIPIACEGDVDGALASLMGCGLQVGPGCLTDWLAHDAHTITLWHGGCPPFSLCEPLGSTGEPRLGRHFNSDKPMVVNAALAVHRPVTLFRLWHCDNAYFYTAQDARTIPPSQSLSGSIGVVELDQVNVRDWFRTLVHAGMPHHLVLFPGHISGLLKELGRCLEIMPIGC